MHELPDGMKMEVLRLPAQVRPATAATPGGSAACSSLCPRIEVRHPSHLTTLTSGPKAERMGQQEAGGALHWDAGWRLPAGPVAFGALLLNRLRPGPQGHGAEGQRPPLVFVHGR